MSRSLLSFLTALAFTGLLAIYTLIATPFDESSTVQAQAPTKPELPLELQYVPPDAAVFLSVDAAKVLDNPIFKAIRKADAKTFEELTVVAKQAFGITPDDVKKFQDSMEKLGKKIDVKIYPNSGHAFENSDNKPAYRADDAADAWQRTVTFLAATLKK